MIDEKHLVKASELETEFKQYDPETYALSLRKSSRYPNTFAVDFILQSKLEGVTNRMEASNWIILASEKMGVAVDHVARMMSENMVQQLVLENNLNWFIESTSKVTQALNDVIRDEEKKSAEIS
nr:hypothetical protein ORM20_00140 [Ochrobactrum phage ORM_20]